MEDLLDPQTAIPDDERSSGKDLNPVVETERSAVWSCNEWDPLEEVIVGNPLNARFPTADLSTQLAEYPDRPLSEIPRGPFPQQILDETEEDLDGFVKILEDEGVKVRRPDTWPHDETFST